MISSLLLYFDKVNAGKYSKDKEPVIFYKIKGILGSLQEWQLPDLYVNVNIQGCLTEIVYIFIQFHKTKFHKTEKK